MLQVTKIFRFETAHAIYGYEGACRYVHGHSYVLHVTVARADASDEYLPAPGFVIDFKDLKRLVNNTVVHRLDHRLVLSKDYIKAHPEVGQLENLDLWDMEPTAENILLFVRDALLPELPAGVRLHRLRIYETADSYAEWESQT